jgi:hypothetical protein
VRPTSFHPDAVAEVIEAAEYYERRSVGLGFDLIAEMERALEQISVNPDPQDPAPLLFV